MAVESSASSTITVAIPFYNGVDYLKLAIESVLAQERPQWRLLIGDDGERDQGVADLVARYADERIRYFRNEQNLGMVRNWNRCIDRADTDFVTLLHGDDQLLPGYVGTILELAERYPEAAAFFCEASIIDETGRPVFSFADAIKRVFVPRGDDAVVLCGERSLETIMAGNFIMCPTLCLRKPILGARRFDDRWRQVQDLEFTSRLLLEGDTLVGSRTTAYAYRRHESSMTSVQSESLLRFEEEFELFGLVADRARERGWHAAAKTSRRAAIVKLHLLYRGLKDAALLRFGPARTKLRYLLRSLS